MKAVNALPLGRRAAAGLLFSLALAACASETPRAPAAPASAAATLAQITTEIGDAACSSAAQCRSLAIGAKSCGGPERYLAWSTQRSDGAKLARLAETLRQQREAENARSGMMSNCQFIPDPGAQCVAGHCQLGGGAGGAQLK